MAADLRSLVSAAEAAICAKDPPKATATSFVSTSRTVIFVASLTWKSMENEHRDSTADFTSPTNGARPERTVPSEQRIVQEGLSTSTAISMALDISRSSRMQVIDCGDRRVGRSDAHSL